MQAMLLESMPLPYIATTLPLVTTDNAILVHIVCPTVLSKQRFVKKIKPCLSPNYTFGINRGFNRMSSELSLWYFG